MPTARQNLPMRLPALIALLCIVGGLGTTRLLGALMDDSFSSYTLGGLGFEWVIIASTAWLLTRSNAAEAAT